MSAAEVTTPETLVSVAENRVKTLLEAELSIIPPERVYTAHARGQYSDDGKPSVVAIVEKGPESVPCSGWFECTISALMDSRGLRPDDAEQTWHEIETALEDGDDDIETRLTAGKLHCADNSAMYTETEDFDGETFGRLYSFVAMLGVES